MMIGGPDDKTQADIFKAEAASISARNLAASVSSEVSQGAMTAVLGGAAAAYGLHIGNTWIVLSGAVVAMYGIARWQRNAALASPARPSAVQSMSGLPDPSKLSVGTRSADGRFVVAPGNRTDGGQVWAIDVLAPQTSGTVAGIVG